MVSSNSFLADLPNGSNGVSPGGYSKGLWSVFIYSSLSFSSYGLILWCILRNRSACVVGDIGKGPSSSGCLSCGRRTTVMCKSHRERERVGAGLERKREKLRVESYRL